jgi:hypothetical protein
MGSATEHDINETKSYRDPFGKRLQAPRETTGSSRMQAPAPKTVYDGFYITFAPTPENKGFLAGAEGIVGTRLLLVAAGVTGGGPLSLTTAAGHELAAGPTGGDPLSLTTVAGHELAAGVTGGSPLSLTTVAGHVLAELSGEKPDILTYYLSSGWVVEATLSLVVYRPSDNSFEGEIACMCYDPGHGASMEPFVRNMVRRISKGDHPDLQLTADQLRRVLESSGAWCMTKGLPLPVLREGAMIYRRRMSFTEGLSRLALEGRIGCKVGIYAFWIVLLAVIVFGVWFFFLRH